MSQSFDDLLKKNSIFRSIFDHSKYNTFLIYNDSGIVLKANESFQNKFGYTTADLEGKHFRVLYTREDQQKNLPEVELKKVLTQGNSDDHNYLVAKTQKKIWVSGESILVKDDDGQKFIIKTIQDIHEQKILEEFLSASNIFIESILQCIEDALIVIDGKLKIVKANNAFYNQFGIQNNAIEGQQFFDVIDPLTLGENFKQDVEEILEKDICFVNKEVSIDPESAGKKTFVVSSSIISNAADKSILMVFHNITTDKQAEEQREDLISFVAHELRNPLSNLTLISALLRDSIAENNHKDSNEFLDKVDSLNERMKRIITELYEATKAGSGQLQIDIKPVLLDEIIKEVVENEQIVHPSHKIIKEGNAEFEIFADRYRIAQVFINFIDNAVKYSPRADKVIVTISREQSEVIISITDFGAGISADKVPFIFNRYYRAGNTLKAEGMGLGLFVSRQIINAHKGRVWVETEPGKGSTFYISLPI